MKKIIALVLFAGFSACSSVKVGDSITYQILTDSQFRGSETEKLEVITNHDDLKKLYKSVGDDMIPNIDFADYRVIAMHVGEVHTGGHTIEIKEVKKTSNGAEVIYKRNYPEGMVAMVISKPYVIAKVKTTGKITFKLYE